jgi:hypothetical protein
VKGAIWRAYCDTGALKIGCPNCGAPRNKWCTMPDGRVRRIPCLRRITISAATAERDDGYRDFSEPAHQTD